MLENAFRHNFVQEVWVPLLTDAEEVETQRLLRKQVILPLSPIFQRISNIICAIPPRVCARACAPENDCVCICACVLRMKVKEGLKFMPFYMKWIEN
jgi:hypothetical protein